MKKFYLSKQWKATRRAKLNKDPLCEYCLEVGKVKQASCVDHYQAISRGGHKTAPDNLRSSCQSCHSKKTLGVDRNQGKDIFKRGCDAKGNPRDGWTGEKSLGADNEYRGADQGKAIREIGD